VRKLEVFVSRLVNYENELKPMTNIAVAPTIHQDHRSLKNGTISGRAPTTTAFVASVGAG